MRNFNIICCVSGIGYNLTNRFLYAEGIDLMSDDKLKKANQLIDVLQNIISVMPGNVYWVDRNNVYQGCNDNMFRLSGLKSKKDIIGKRNIDLPWNKNNKALAEELDRINTEVMESGEIRTVEEPAELADGSKKMYLSSKVPLYDANGSITGLVGISTDITDRKKMEEDLRKAKEAAEKAKYMMTEFISNMGHDLATPITDVETVVMMLDEYADEYPELKDILQTLTERAAACEVVRKRILNATSLSNLEVKLETFSVIEVILALEKKFRSEIDGKKLKLVIHPLKPKKEDVITADREKFSAILEELLLNAIHFTDEGSISISIIKENDIIDIEVSDTGMGIPADKFDYIFEPYTKLAASNQFGQTFKGPGCGLYLVEVRANILGASINVKSALGKGSTFTLSIPVHPEK